MTRRPESWEYDERRNARIRCASLSCIAFSLASSGVTARNASFSRDISSARSLAATSAALRLRFPGAISAAARRRPAAPDPAPGPQPCLVCC